MAATFQILWGEIKDSFPNLSSFLAKRFVQRAVSDIYQSRQWSFLTADGILFSPQIITSGSFNITQFSNTIIASSTAITALNGLSNPILTKRQIRFTGSGQIYSIIGVDPLFSSNGILTLDRPVVDSTSTSTSYQVYRCYYGPPQTGLLSAETTDFLRFNSIYNPAISEYFRGVSLPIERLNKKDPQRMSIGSNPYFTFFAKSDSLGNPVFEMWPHPTSQATYLVNYQRRGIEPSLNSDILPLIISDDLVLERAMWYGCLWAAKNAQRFSELKGVNWQLLAQQHLKEYSNFSSSQPGVLEQTQVNDEEINPSSMIIDDRSYNDFAIGDDLKTGYYSINP